MTMSTFIRQPLLNAWIVGKVMATFGLRAITRPLTITAPISSDEGAYQAGNPGLGGRVDSSCADGGSKNIVPTYGKSCDSRVHPRP